ncbi:MAG: hypothetical protein R2798_11255 [Chitinophagales bacterium]
MKKINILSIIAVLFFSAWSLHAGNDDRVGQAGASELLINPWARSAGMHGINMASARGI